MKGNKTWTVDPKVREIIDAYIANELLVNSDLEAIILCGSQAAGTATAHSDIDLCYIGKFSEFRREFKYFNNYEFQIMIAPWDWYKEVLNGYERKSNIGTITTMLAKGVCLWSNCTKKWIELHEEASAYYASGPTPASQEELTRIRKRITELWNNFMDADNEVTSAWIRNQILQSCVDAHFIIHHWWAVKPKYQMNELRRRDPLLADYIVECLHKLDVKKSLQTVCEYVLNPIGGLLK
ncbi:nucleotidyltransferase domain-containing protein [Paenibacillus allorhizosphaerae]|uniref:Polymerase nucleotidyl transferase domain-containing protein n=1 Tax=Paenibacillus allorhizosphaerae TaxID=2849866 RepID=A0ABN7TEF1_9BACL|nr:nucleotidyltransferase domain-containing protein [Paenibacillus allorhizosphaerae]CAG7619353.1 hypothetical protein PAECIP111802_00611 [Paenibacillus allorhizosphaerae]